MFLIKLLNVKVYLNPLFLVIIVLFSLTGMLAEGIILFLIVLFHEFGHIIAAKSLKYDVEKVELLPVGGVAVINQPLEFNGRNEWFIALAGPFNNLMMIALCFAFKDYLSHYQLILNANITLFLFNLLPAFPLDGGRVLRAYLSKKIPLNQANKIAVLMGFFCGILIMLISIYSFWIRAVYALYLLILSAFLVIASQKEYSRSAYSYFNLTLEKKEAPKSKEVLTAQVLMAHCDSIIYNVIKELSTRHISLVVVVDDDGEIIDFVTEYLLLDALKKGKGTASIKTLLY
ncbi:M50 family metallopeptidase [Proteinivorax hydrogeniformans]|uniref:M50 family metallopeptidase n=1 Tax=Proteinivorax hydrogeniformans TaxID=1826727 RepID=A0AAU8HWJ2_9FIRM